MLLLKSAKFSKKIDDGPINMIPSNNNNNKLKKIVSASMNQLILIAIGGVFFARGISPAQKW